MTAAESLLVQLGGRPTYGGYFMRCRNHPTPTDALVMWAGDSEDDAAPARTLVLVSCSCDASPLRLAHGLKIARLLHPTEMQHIATEAA